MPYADTPENREKLRVKARAYYRANAEVIKAKHRETNRVTYLANKDAVLTRVRQYQQANPEKVREKNRAWADANRDRINVVHVRYVSRDSELPRTRARNALSNAVRDGRVVKKPCEICGSFEKVHGHHAFGYSEPMALAVWWLCPPHHRGLHMAIRGVST